MISRKKAPAEEISARTARALTQKTYAANEVLSQIQMRLSKFTLRDLEVNINE